MRHVLKSENFEMSMKLKVFESEISYPTNTIMEIAVQSNNFSAVTSMDIDIKNFAKFACDLVSIYESLSGEAMIMEPYGVKMYISFFANASGHISIKGCLQSSDDGYMHRMEFENEIDQTYLREFCYELRNMYDKYLI